MTGTFLPPNPAQVAPELFDSLMSSIPYKRDGWADGIEYIYKPTGQTVGYKLNNGTCFIDSDFFKAK